MIKMTETEIFYEICRDFDQNNAKFNWWNGAEFGTILGQIITLFEHSNCWWWLFGAFWVEFAMACYYQRRGHKILKKMDKFVKNGQKDE